MAPTQALETTGPHKKVKIFNDKTDNQAVIERRLVGQLGDNFSKAQLIELSRNSYLISNQVRLPILGQQIRPIMRDKDNFIDRKGYVLMKDSEFFSSSGRRIDHLYKGQLIDNETLKKYVLDPRMQRPLQLSTNSIQQRL